MNNNVLEAAEQLRRIIAENMELLRELPEQVRSQRPAPDKWSKKEIMGHLIDSACNNHQKFLRTQLAEGPIQLSGYRQNDWVAVQQYQQADWGEMLALWKAYNLHLAWLMSICPPEKHKNTVSIDGGPPVCLDFIMTDYVEHLKHHLRVVLPDASF